MWICSASFFTAAIFTDVGDVGFKVSLLPLLVTRVFCGEASAANTTRLNGLPTQ